ncbi:MAG: Nramp family divalent metal transporter, partial [Candidatus Omnitrophica bacterium]|nr:Nramp family divalent metal transporter [Candidatus Omnitrophota bacterium]
TILLFIFGSLAVLHPRGIVPSQGTLIWDMASLLGEVWGPAGRTLFLVVGVATLFSTQLTLVDGVSRSIADIVYTNYVGAKKRPLAWWYLVVASVWMVVGCGITYVMEKRGVSELGFLFNAAYMGGFAMAVYTPLTLYMNHRLLPKCARPGPICTLMLIVASILYIGFAAACLYWEVMG